MRRSRTGVITRLVILVGVAAALAGCDKCGHVDFTLHPKTPHACTAG